MARHALEYALKNHGDAEITVLHVVGKTTPMMGEIVGLALDDDIGEAAEKRAEPVFEVAKEQAKAYEKDIDTRVVIGHPIRTILDRSAEYDLVVLGSHSGTLADRLYVGNVAKTIVQRAPVPVTVVR